MSTHDDSVVRLLLGAYEHARFPLSKDEAVDLAASVRLPAAGAGALPLRVVLEGLPEDAFRDMPTLVGRAAARWARMETTLASLDR